MWPRKVHKDHMRLVHQQVLDYYGDAVASDSSPTFPRGGTTYGIKFRNPRDAATFRRAFESDPFRYGGAGGTPATTLRTKLALPPDQRARGKLLHPIFALVNTGDFENNVKTYYPKGSRPITALAYAADNGSLEDLVIIEFTARETDVTIKAVQLAQSIAGNLSTMAKIADLSGVRPSVMEGPDEDLR